MSVRVSEALQSKIESDIAQSKVDIKKNQDTFSQKNISQDQASKDMTDLGAWSVTNSQSLQNMNQYALSAHKMSTLAEDFHRLMMDESEEDWVSTSAPGDNTSAEQVPFNQFEDVDLAGQTSQETSINDALGSFSRRLKAEREQKVRDRLLNGRAEDKAALALEARVQIKRLRIDKIVLKKKMERLTNPVVDVVVAAGQNEIEEKRAQPKPKPDVSVVVVRRIAMNPKPDYSVQRINQRAHEKLMEAFQGESHALLKLHENNPDVVRRKEDAHKALMESFGKKSTS